MPEQDPKREQGKEAPSSPDLQMQKKTERASFGGRFRAFRKSGLGLFDSLYNAWYVSLCEGAEKRGREPSESLLIRFLSAAPRKIRSFFAVFTPSFWKKGKETNHYHRKRDYLKAHLPHLVCVVLVIVAVVSAYLKLSRPLALSAEIDGERIAVVENESEVRSAVAELEQNVENVLGRDFRFPYSIRYVFTPLTGNMKLSAKGEISEALYSYVTDYICTASGLYLDESLVAVAADRAALESVLDQLVEEKRAETGVEEVGIYNEVQILDQAYPTSSILSPGDLYDYLKKIAVPFGERDAAQTDATPTESVRPVFVNGSLYADTQLAMTPVTRHRSNYPRSSTTAHLAFYTTEPITYEVEIPYITVYDERADLYTSMADVTTVGVNGKEQIEAKLYWVDGSEARREILQSSVLREPVNEVVSSGIKILPEDLGITGFQNRFIYPKVTYVFSGFGPREGGYHYGWDLPGRQGENIYAAASGVVVAVRYNEFEDAVTELSGSTFSGYGCFVLLRHDNHYSTMYAHCSKVNVRLWQEVKQGDKIGEIGSTGMADGPHCHFEIIEDGRRVNPANGYMYEGTATVNHPT